MTVSHNYIAYIVDKLVSIAPVTTRRVFGGLVVYCNHQLFAILANNCLYFRTDPTNCRDYEALGMLPFQPQLKASSTCRYYQVPDWVLDDTPTLRFWMLRACGHCALATME